MNGSMQVKNTLNLILQCPPHDPHTVTEMHEVHAKNFYIIHFKNVTCHILNFIIVTCLSKIVFLWSRTLLPSK